MPTTREIGVTGLSAWGGHIYDDFLAEMRGLQGVKKYREMWFNSPIIAALMTAVEHSVRGVRWTIESDRGDDDPRIEFVQDCMDGMMYSWNDHISEALSMLAYGWAYFEVVYRRDGSRLVWDKLAIRGQDTLDKWELDPNGTIRGMWQTTKTGGSVLIPIEKAILYRTRVERNNPEGRSILRASWIPYYYLKNIMQIEGIGIERDLAGLPVISMPEGATTSTTDSSSDAYRAAKIVRNIRRDEQEGLVLPFGWTFTLAASGGSRQFDTDAVIRRYESRMLMSALAQFLILGQDGVGSMALSRDQTDFFTMSVNATADIIADTLTRHTIPKLLTLNGLDADGITLAHTPAGDVDINGVADFLQKTGSLITWTAQDEAWLRSIGKLPEIDEAELEIAREDKAERAAGVSKRMAQDAQDDDMDDQEPPTDDDDMSAHIHAEHYSAGRAPDDDERRRQERRMERLLVRYFAEEKKKLLAEAKRVRRG